MRRQNEAIYMIKRTQTPISHITAYGVCVLLFR